jgi:AraC-like DNA-binding protein
MAFLIRSACLTGYVELAQSLGLDPFRLLREANLDRSCLFDPEIKIPVDAANRLLEISASAARVEDFGLRLAESRRFSNLGPVALGTRDAATLREALEAAIRYLPLHNEAMVLSLVAMDDLVILKSEIIGDAGSQGRQGIELSVGVVHRFVRQLSGETWRSRPVWFSHSAPMNMASHLRMFGPWVEFGQDCSGIVIEAGDLERPLPTSDAAMARHVKQYLDPMLAQAHATTSEKVRGLVYDLLVSRSASADEVASRLGMNRRNLHRHLARDGETFASIRDAVRTDLARRYVEDRGLPLREVARLLGFSEASAFSRWFHSKFDCNPMSWRTAERGRGTGSSSEVLRN